MLCSMALPSNVCAALHGQSNVCSMCDCNPCRSLDLSVWWKVYQELSVTMVWVPEGTVVSTQLKVNIMANIKVMLSKDAPLSSHLANYIL